MMGYRVYITGSGIAEEAQQLLREEDCAFAVGDPKDTPADIARELAMFHADGVIVRQGRITAEVLDAAAKVKVICKHGVGTDNIDLAAATRRGIPVMFTPLANYESVAEHTLTLILSLVRRIPLEDKRIRAGIFSKKNYDGLELLGKTLGIIGFGHVGRRLAELVAPFRMTVIAYDPFFTTAALPHPVTKAGNAADIFSQADIISLHCPLTPDTRNLINAQTIAQMKLGVYIINTARGGIVNEADLLRALQDQQVGGAALDVFEVEPPAGDHPLFQLNNVIFTSHVAGASDNSLKNMGVESVSNVLAVLKGHVPDRESLANPEVLGVQGKC
jgi:D-3-phosphoglycerate dehydrogenase